MRTYRVTVIGQFRNLSPEVKAQLKAEAEQHDMFNADFTPEGIFLYSSALTRFTVRYLITSDEAAPADADVAATMEAEDAASAMLAERGVTHGELTSTFVCLEDVKTRPKK